MTCERYQRLIVGAVLGAAWALAACGGSSSETPPPLEPDPRGFHYASVLPAVTLASDAGAAPSTEDDVNKPRSKAGSTWGAPKPKLQ